MGALIGLDARMVGRIPSGLGTYAGHLARALVARDRINSYVIIRGPDSPSPIATGPNVQEVVLPGDLDTPRNLVRGGDISRLGLDVYHSLHHFLPPALRVPRVVLTLHDLIWIEHPALIRDGRFAALACAATHWFARGAMSYALHRADRIIAVSKHSRSRALAYYGLEPSRIDVVYHGIDHDAFRPSPNASAEATPYFLCLGNTRPYKNIGTAIRALALCARDRPDVRMVVSGRGDSIDTLTHLARELGIGRRVIFTAPLSHSELLRFLHGAAALVFPSLIEGFGFPVLEALAAGCPVIASDCPTVVEIAGPAALFCDPRKPEAFAAAMTRILGDTQARSDLRQRGIRRAADFSWDRCAAETLAVYEKLLDPVRHHDVAMAPARS
jgi:glycosyltransferase involved in cell wall biosynthesis